MLGNNGGDPGAAESGGSSGGAPPESGSGGGNRWPRQETVALIEIRRDMDVAFRDASLKGPLWEEVSRKLGELGYHRSAKKCKEKFENVFKYHKRTKDGRSTKSEGKTYRFFDQLEALDSQPTQSQPPPPHPPHSHQAATQATPLLIAMPVTGPTAAPTFTTTNNTTVSSAQNLPQLQNTISIPQILAPISVHSTNSFPLNTIPPQPNPFSISFSTPIPPSNQNPTSVSSPSSTSSDEEPKRRSKNKRKWADFFERLTSEVMAKQEEMQKKFLEALEKHEQERIARDEAWRAQELARMSQEREILAHERAVAAAKDAALFAFLQKVSASDQQIPNPSQTSQQNNIAPLLPSPSEPVQQNPPPQLLPQPPISAPTLVQQMPPPRQLRPQPPASMPAPLQQTPPPPPQHAPQSPVSAPTPVSALPPPLPAPPPSQLHLRLLQSAHSSKKIITDSGGEIVNFNPNPSSSRWPKTEIEALIKLRINLDLKYQENVPKGPLWEEISAGMLRLGYNRNAKRCKEKWENINKYYKKVKESNKKRPEDSKTCPYFSQLDAIYKERAKSETHFKQEHVGAPIMAQPEQQWPVQSRPELPLMEGHDSDDDMDDDDDDEDEAGKYELVANKPSSVGTAG